MTPEDGTVVLSWDGALLLTAIALFSAISNASTGFGGAILFQVILLICGVGGYNAHGSLTYITILGVVIFFNVISGCSFTVIAIREIIPNWRLVVILTVAAVAGGMSGSFSLSAIANQGEEALDALRLALGIFFIVFSAALVTKELVMMFKERLKRTQGRNEFEERVRLIYLCLVCGADNEQRERVEENIVEAKGGGGGAWAEKGRGEGEELSILEKGDTSLPLEGEVRRSMDASEGGEGGWNYEQPMPLRRTRIAGEGGGEIDHHDNGGGGEGEGGEGEGEEGAMSVGHKVPWCIPHASSLSDRTFIILFFFTVVLAGFIQVRMRGLFFLVFFFFFFFCFFFFFFFSPVVFFFLVFCLIVCNIRLYVFFSRFSLFSVLN